MAHAPDIRDKLRKAYVFNGLSMEIAAAQAGVAFATARRWKKEAAEAGDDWDKLRAAYMMAGGGLEDVSRAVLTSLVVQCQTTLEQINTTSDITAINRVELLASLADAYTKTVAASKKVLPETSQLATALDVLHRLGAFIQERYPQHLGVFAEVLEPFGEALEKSYG